MGKIARWVRKIVGEMLYVVAKRVCFLYLFPPRLSARFESLRCFALRLQGASIGKNAVIRRGCFIVNAQFLRVGQNSTIGPFARIFNYAPVSIGHESEIGPGLHIQTNDHVWADVNQPIGKQGVRSGEVSVGDGVYIGCNVTILQGVTVGDRCVVAAGSVVINSVPAGMFVAGVPARPKREVLPLEDF